MEAKIKLEKRGGGRENGVGTPSLSNHSRRRSFGRPSWLLFTIADLDDRMKMITTSTSEEENADSFANRADAYYQKRPQLLALLQDLYNSYVSLADRYCQSLAKTHHHRRYSSPISPLHFNENDQFDEEDCGETVDSDVESSLSYQIPFPASGQCKMDTDMIVADLVMKLEVLESERLILLNENASLSFRVNALLEENKGLASESLFMKRKAADLARCVLKMREDHRVCILQRSLLQLYVHPLRPEIHTTYWHHDWNKRESSGSR